MEETTIIEEPMRTTETVRKRLFELENEDFIITLSIGHEAGGEDER